MLSTLFLSHLGKFAFGNRRFFVPLLQFLVCQEVLCHDPRDLSEVIEDGKARILHFLLGRAEAAEFVVAAKRSLRI